MSACENMKDETKISTNRRTYSSNRQLTAEELAPDGGWGWIVFAGTTLGFMVFSGGVSSFGMIYGEFLTETGNDGSALTTLNIMFTASFSFSGLLCNELLKRCNIKFIGVIGSLMYGFANILIPLMPSVGYMMITQLLQGIAMGLMICVAITSLNSYFVKRRALVFTMSQVIASTAAIFFPYLAEYLLSTYGFRGCLIVLSAISLNATCAMLTIQPVEMYYKKPKLVSRKASADCDAEINEGGLSDNTGSIGPESNLLIEATDGWRDVRSKRTLKPQTGGRKPSLIKALTASDPSQNCLVSSFDPEMGCHPRIPWRGSNQELYSNRVSLVAATSMASISGVGGICNLEHQIVEVKAKDDTEVKRGIASIVADFFEVSLLHDKVYLNMCLTMSLMGTADANFHNFLPLILTNDGYSTVEVALLLTVSAIAEVVSRIGLATFVVFFKAKARYIHFGSLCALLICRIAFIYCYDLSNVIIVIVAINLTRSWYLVTQSLVIAEHFTIKSFSAAYGLYVIIMGIVQLVVTPVIGLIKDLAKSYIVMQYILIGIMTCCIVSWVVQIWICDILPRHKKTVDAETECSKT